MLVKSNNNNCLVPCLFSATHGVDREVANPIRDRGLAVIDQMK